VIKKEEHYIEAHCDVCKKTLLVVEKWHEKGDPKNPEQTTVYCEYATLQSHFGYGSSRFDMLVDHYTKIHLCEDCYGKVLAFLKLDDEGKPVEEKSGLKQGELL